MAVETVFKENKFNKIPFILNGKPFYAPPPLMALLLRKNKICGFPKAKLQKIRFWAANIIPFSIKEKNYKNPNHLKP